MSSFPPPPLPHDPLAERLERLAQRRASTPSTSRQPGAERPSRQRRHPARSARLGALAVSCASAGGLTYLFADTNATQASNASLAALPAPIAASAPASASTTPAPTPAPSTSSQSTTAASTAASTTVAPATTATTAFDGQIVDTRFGPVQVQVQVTDGAISDVAVVEYPNGDGKSLRINARALPELRSEVLTAQSAQVDTVSGATYTSGAYSQSLQSAIDQARAAGVTALA